MEKKLLNKETIAKMIDISALPAYTTEHEVEQLAAAANQYGFIAAFVMPNHIQYLQQCLGNESDVIMGAPIGFPTGADLMQDKVFQVQEMKKLGCTEFDMVMAVGKLKSARYDYVKEDILRVMEAAQGHPVKVILEVTYLTDDEIKRASEIVASAGAAYVKTGTGYAKKPTELHHVELMKQVVGDRIKIKVAGGVRDFDTLCSFYKAGAERFGIGMDAAVKIMQSI